MRKAAPFIAAISVIVSAGLGTSRAASSVPRLLRLDVSSKFAVRPATMNLGCCGQFVIGGPGVSSRAFRSQRLGRLRWKHWGSAQSTGVGLLWIDNGVPSCGSETFRSTRVSIRAYRLRNGRYTRLLLVYRLGKRRVLDRRRLGRVRTTKRPAYEWFTSKTHGGPAPKVSAGGARSVTQTAATLSGSVNPNGRWTNYYFQYGTSRSYGSVTASQAARPGRTAVNVAANLGGLSAGTTYHYRIYANNASGTACGSDRAFTTVMTTQQLDASRAVATYDTMQQHFYAAAVYSGGASRLYAENYPQSGRRYAFLWPFSRALVGTITLAGVSSTLVGGASYQADVADRLTGLSRYWDRASAPPGYDSYPPAPHGAGGDKYYDDQAWVGLAAAQNYAMTGDPISLADAKNVFNFVYPGGWAGGASFEPGGIY